jgi:hypothetical protein
MMTAIHTDDEREQERFSKGMNKIDVSVNTIVLAYQMIPHARRNESLVSQRSERG